MSTTMPKAGEISRKWYVLDAADKPLGRTADRRRLYPARQTQSTILPLTLDCGDHVIIINAEKAVLTGKKLEQKYYRHHSGWVGGLKEVQIRTS